MTMFCNRFYIPILAIVVLLICLSCSDAEMIEPEVMMKPNPDVPVVTIDPDKIVTINAGSIVGPLYNFWSTRPMVNQTMF